MLLDSRGSEAPPGHYMCTLPAVPMIGRLVLGSQIMLAPLRLRELR
jgi:hypothetical protein